MGGKLKHMLGNLQAMNEKGEIKKTIKTIQQHLRWLYIYKFHATNTPSQLICPCIIYYHSKTWVAENLLFLSQLSINKTYIKLFYIDLIWGPNICHFYNWKWQLDKVVQHVISTVNTNHYLLISGDFSCRISPN